MRGEIKINVDHEEQQQSSKLCFLPSAEKGQGNKQTNPAPLDDGAPELPCLKENLCQRNTNQHHPAQNINKKSQLYSSMDLGVFSERRRKSLRAESHRLFCLHTF